jgi:uncharacterized Tic20 family protein
MIAHLAAVANFVFPFAGLIGAILVYTARRHDLPIVRDNARNAINMQITLAILNVILIFAALVCFGWLFASIPARGHQRGASQPLPWPMFAYFGCFLALLVANLTVAIMASFGARVAYLGRVFRYPIAISFVRPAAGETS